MGLSNAAAALSLSSSPPVTSAVVPPMQPGASSPIASSFPDALTASSLPAPAPVPPFLPPPSLPVPRITTHPSGHQSFNGILSVGALESLPPPTSAILGSKKKGTIFRCESCSKVYRHPSCLVKHRWEHTAHWKESSRFLLSKHQQVQLLEVRLLVLPFFSFFLVPSLSALCSSTVETLGPCPTLLIVRH